jgi:sec-independent protein translocase protein TatB
MFVIPEEMFVIPKEIDFASHAKPPEPHEASSTARSTFVSIPAQAVSWGSAMPSFQDSAVLVLLALLLFGPKKLPVLARQLGKLMADFRRASNEFRTQMEEELRISEQAERQKQIAAIEAAAPPSPAIEIPEPEHPHLPPPAPSFTSTETEYPPTYPDSEEAQVEAAPAPLPIATSGELSILPPSTGLPIASTPSSNGAGPENVQSSSIEITTHEAVLETETLHG